MSNWQPAYITEHELQNCDRKNYKNHGSLLRPRAAKTSQNLRVSKERLFALRSCVYSGLKYAQNNFRNLHWLVLKFTCFVSQHEALCCRAPYCTKKIACHALSMEGRSLANNRCTKRLGYSQEWAENKSFTSEQEKNLHLRLSNVALCEAL